MSEMMTLDLDDSLNQRLEKLSHATARSKSSLVMEALQEYLVVNEWQMEAIEEGIKQADEGQLISHEDLRQKWEQKLANNLDQSSVTRSRIH